MWSTLKTLLSLVKSLIKSLAFRIMIGPLGALVVGYIGKTHNLDRSMYCVLSMTAWMVLWWLNEVVRMGITSLLPIAMFPILGILSASGTSSLYFSDGVIVCWGSMLMATAIEKYGIHSRFANYFLRRVSNDNFPALLLVFIFSTGFISMWISNTATTALMAPLAKAVFVELKATYDDLYEEDEDENRHNNTTLPYDNYRNNNNNNNNYNISTITNNSNKKNHYQIMQEKLHNAAIAVDLGIAFASSIGGIATLTGTGTNLVLQGTLLSQFGPPGNISFFDWFLMACPLSLINLFILWLILALWFINSNIQHLLHELKLICCSCTCCTTSPTMRKIIYICNIILLTIYNVYMKIHDGILYIISRCQGYTQVSGQKSHPLHENEIHEDSSKGQDLLHSSRISSNNGTTNTNNNNNNNMTSTTPNKNTTTTTSNSSQQQIGITVQSPFYSVPNTPHHLIPSHNPHKHNIISPIQKPITSTPTSTNVPFNQTIVNNTPIRQLSHTQNNHHNGDYQTSMDTSTHSHSHSHNQEIIRNPIMTQSVIVTKSRSSLEKKEEDGGDVTIHFSEINIDDDNNNNNNNDTSIDIYQIDKNSDKDDTHSRTSRSSYSSIKDKPPTTSLTSNSIIKFTDSNTEKTSTTATRTSISGMTIQSTYDPRDHRTNTLTTELNPEEGVGGGSTSQMKINKRSDESDLTYTEWVVLLDFVLMAALWMTRDPPGGWGWANLWARPEYITDGTVAMFCALLLFFIPRNDSIPTRETIYEFYRYMLSKLESMRQYCIQSYMQFISSTHNNNNNNSSSTSQPIRTNNNTSQNSQKDSGQQRLQQQSMNGSVHNQNNETKDSGRQKNRENDDEDEESLNFDSFLYSYYAHAMNPIRVNDDDETKSNLDSSPSTPTKNKITSSSAAAVPSTSRRISIKSYLKKDYTFILSWTALQMLNWDIVFLLGGGFALSKGYQESGLTQLITKRVRHSGFSDVSFLICFSSLFACFITNFMSNIAVANILFPALACMGPSHNTSPLYFLAPVTFCISFAFLSPIGTPSNAIIMTNDNVTLKHMFKVGGICTIVMLAITIVYCLFILPLIMTDIHKVQPDILENCSI